MNWQELRKEAYNLPVHERLLLLEAIAHSLSQELRPRTPPSERRLAHLSGLLKADTPPITEEEVKEERIQEKYLK